MFSVVVDAKQLRKALKEIKRAESNGFDHCLAVFDLKKYGEKVSDCKIEFIDLIEKAHPKKDKLNWGRGQRVTHRYKFVDGELVPIPSD
jgi:hypothetical protein